MDKEKLYLIIGEMIERTDKDYILKELLRSMEYKELKENIIFIDTVNNFGIIEQFDKL